MRLHLTRHRRPRAQNAATRIACVAHRLVRAMLPRAGMNARHLPLLLVLACAPLACVSAGRYDQAVAQAKRSDDDAALAHRQLDEMRARLRDREQSLKDLEVTAGSLQKQLDDQTAIDAELRRALEKLGKDVDALLADANATTLAEAKKRLQELRRAQAAAEARAALYAQLLTKFKEMVDAGDLAVVIRDGRMILRLPNDVLFDAGRIDVKPAGKKALHAIAVVLVTMPDRHFQVAGHTDDQPIKVSPYASNWELSTARALEVVQFLVKEGMKPSSLSAAGYGEFDPIADNALAGGQIKNRRIEIVLQPNLDEMVVLAKP